MLLRPPLFRNGAFVADVVGLGKSYIGAAIVKHFERTERVRPLIICPAPLVNMWERYNEVYQLNARVLSIGYLRNGDSDGFSNLLLEDVRYKDRDFILVDESHNLRHSDTQRYQVRQAFLETGRSGTARLSRSLRLRLFIKLRLNESACVKSVGAYFGRVALTKSVAPRSVATARACFEAVN